MLAFWRDREERWSFAAPAERARRPARGLIRAGVRRGEPVAIFAPNRSEWIVEEVSEVPQRDQ